MSIIMTSEQVGLTIFVGASMGYLNAYPEARKQLLRLGFICYGITTALDGRWLLSLLNIVCFLLTPIWHKWMMSYRIIRSKPSDPETTARQVLREKTGLC